MLQVSQEKITDISNTVLNINGSESLDNLASKFLHSFESIVQFDQASFFLYEKSQGYYCPAAINIANKYLDEYSEYYHEVDEVTNEIGQQKSYRYSDILPIDQMLESETYNDHFKPMGAFYTQGINLFEDNQHMGIVTLFREKANRNFTKDEQFLIEIFQPHLVNKVMDIKAALINPCPIRNPNRKKEIMKEEFHLTRREIEIAEMILQGNTNIEISDKLFIELCTVKTHIKNIFKKLNISNRSQIMNSLVNSAKGKRL